MCPGAPGAAGCICVLLPIHLALRQRSLYHAHAGIVPIWLLPLRRFPVKRGLHLPVLLTDPALLRRSALQYLLLPRPRREPVGYRDSRGSGATIARPVAAVPC